MLDLRDGAVALHEHGAGEVVLLLHGVLTSSFLFEPILPALTERYRVLVPDLLGCGESEKVERGLAISDHARRTLEILDALDLTQVHLIGHDVGGGIAQLVALDAPERLLSLTLINPVGYHYWPVPAIETLRLPIIRQFVMASFDVGTLGALVRHGLAHPERLDAALLADFRRPFESRTGRRAFLAFLRALDASELSDRSAELRGLKPAPLLIRGEDDRYLSREICARLARDIPGSRLVILPGAGHFAMQDAGEAIGQLLLEHLSGEDPSQTGAQA